jgi:hypothetical protein
MPRIRSVVHLFMAALVTGIIVALSAFSYFAELENRRLRRSLVEHGIDPGEALSGRPAADVNRVQSCIRQLAVLRARNELRAVQFRRKLADAKRQFGLATHAAAKQRLAIRARRCLDAIEKLDALDRGLAQRQVALYEAWSRRRLRGIDRQTEQDRAQIDAALGRARDEIARQEAAARILDPDIEPTGTIDWDGGDVDEFMRRVPDAATTPAAAGTAL